MNRHHHTQQRCPGEGRCKRKDGEVCSNEIMVKEGVRESRRQHIWQSEHVILVMGCGCTTSN